MVQGEVEEVRSEKFGEALLQQHCVLNHVNIFFLQLIIR